MSGAEPSYPISVQVSENPEERNELIDVDGESENEVNNDETRDVVDDTLEGEKKKSKVGRKRKKYSSILRSSKKRRNVYY
jgi:hypothetical protein